MSLKQAAKDRLLWAIRQVVLPFGRVILLLDHHSLRIVSACCSVSELMDEGVDLVEIIAKRRQPLRKKVALYLISDESGALDQFIADFDPGNELYKAAFVIFNYHLSDDLELRKIAEKVEIDRILGCTELHLNFLAYEERIFHGNLGFTLLNLYQHEESFVHRVASRLASLCSTIRALPIIRYQQCGTGLPEKLAKAAQTLIRDTSPEDANQSNDMLIIIDRSFDVVPLVIHEYTYQAFVYDMLRIPCCSDPKDHQTDDVWEFEYVSNSGKHEKRKALLTGDKDVLWHRFRHMHIQKVNEAVSEEVEKFTMQATGTSLKRSSRTQDVLTVVRGLPKTQYMMEKYWAHVSLTERSFEQLEAKRIMNVGALEQVLATNLDRHGSKQGHSKTLNQLLAMVEDVTVDEELKIRLIILYFAVYRNLRQENLSEILKVSGLCNSSMDIIGHFIDIYLGSTIACSPNSPRSSSSSHKIIHRHAEKGDAYQYYKKHAEKNEYELSRYIPEIQHVIARVVAGTLEEEKFPTLHEGPSSNTQKAVTEDRRIVVYVVGGITLSEMRVVYDISEKTKANIYLGGDSILVPSAIFDNMKKAI